MADDPTFWAYDPASPEGDHSCQLIGVRRLDRYTFICEVPEALGEVTKLETKNGRVIATTASGIEMIVPISGTG